MDLIIPRVVIGLSGHMGAGKGTAVEMLKLIFGDKLFLASTTKIIEDALRDRGVENPNKVKVKQRGFEEIAAEEGEGWLHKKAHGIWHDFHTPHLIEAHSQFLCVYDSVRTERDTRWLLGFSGALLIHTHADAKTRFDRIRKRAGQGGPGAKDDEKEISFEEFLKRHEHSTAQFVDSIPKISRVVVLDNNNTTRAFGAQLIAVLMTKGLISFPDLEKKKPQLEAFYQGF